MGGGQAQRGGFALAICASARCAKLLLHTSRMMRHVCHQLPVRTVLRSHRLALFLCVRAGLARGAIQHFNSFAAARARASTVDVLTMRNAIGQQGRPLHSLLAQVLQVFQRRVMMPGEHRNHDFLH